MQGTYEKEGNFSGKIERKLLACQHFFQFLGEGEGKFLMVGLIEMHAVRPVSVT